MSERTILAFKIQSKKTNSDQGDIKPVAEILDDKLAELHEGNFCYSNKVFVTTGYQLIDEKYREGQIFRISVKPSEQMSSLVDPSQASKYVCQGLKAEKLKPNELIEIIDGELPDKNKRYFENELLPSTEYIFIRNKDGECFGPFSWDNKEDDFGFSLCLLDDKPLLKKYNLNIGQIFKIKAENIEKYAFKFIIDNRVFHFLLSIQGFISGYEIFDYASDEEIVKHCAKLANEIPIKSLNKSDWDSLKKLANINPKFNQGINKERLNKLSTIVSDSFLLQDDIRENIESFLKRSSGEKLISSFIERKRPQLLEVLRKEVITEKNTEIEKIEEKINLTKQQYKEKDRELKEWSEKVEQKRKEANQEVILERAVVERNEKLQILDQKIIEKERQLDEITKHFNLSMDLSEITQQIEDNKVIQKHYEKENRSIQQTTEFLERECLKKEDELRIKLIELKPFVDHINGSFFDHKTEKDRTVFVETTPILNMDILECQRLVVETVKRNLSIKGRDFESWQVANLLISTQQSFITFLAGLPGVGKTSLARLIAQAQQLEPRLQEVSVARGWTSQKDLIGFYNPLSNRFQSSNSGLYSFIGALGLENKKDEQAMAYVLLDEANLSPIEHYWSAFMAMTDGEGERVLRLGQDTLTVPTTLRFLATINYDGTTEPLSPRVVDRAPVLVMEACNNAFEENDSEEQIIPLPLSAIEMNKLFGLKEEKPDFQDEEKDVFNKVRDILSHPSLEEGRPSSISPRKEIVIRQYCAQAGALMRSFGCEDFKALDLAILQHVLPQVRGNGQKFATRLKKLKQACDDSGLKDSANYLERMIAYGETELHSYDFFCW
jgi:adenylate kinase family enzyme